MATFAVGPGKNRSGSGGVSQVEVTGFLHRDINMSFRTVTPSSLQDKDKNHSSAGKK